MSIGYLQRKAAWEILLKVSSGDFSDHALDKVLKNYKFNSLDIAFITELSFGCIRYRKFLDLWVDHTSKITHKKQPPKLRWLLHIGLYQLLKMDKIPFPAAISTTVEVAKKTDLKGLAGTVNAILRNASRNLKHEIFPKLSSDKKERISYLESLPLWLVNDLYKWLGNSKSENIVKAFNKKPSIDLRINPLKTDLDKFLKVLHENKIDAEIIKDLNNGITLKSNPRSIKNLPGFCDGLWTIQDRSSQWVATLLNPKEGEKILDACAAPGIKSTHLAELANDNSEILAVDRSEKRLKILQSNLDRLNLNSVTTLKADATSLIKFNPKFVSYFDKILLDAPCSGIGTLARNPDARWSLSKEKINDLTLLQEKLLECIFPLLKKDGILVYSTCTICPDENNLLVERFIEKNKETKLISQKQIYPSLDYAGDGFYAAKISYQS
ncbi:MULTISPECIES: 16S rRNA (cytosine(967)-C(5))-methyltransferase [Prochlorococcus]|uniref:16S rRNA (cytosine(967)-C(5))-methyltransferase n=1 Tax=Prochlorococcus marinus str. MIT 9116 TaxID=167544 RepID=A0A0A1ZS95_PROMR|nr:16S rRNA (cytosine(967)-C(5))-methyltransferase [Prochlorococcus marinus]KGF90157.1 Ribosomal RNA small subunit methyltransferase B [Prochlorococcus marinus str. MIT 9107]KGF92462.1 Ribosomal RNA small subunit methyltransferase B [Prochlorococcus marinus str. MIT 9116]KGF94905.1 Ribosomal RNA small subunit methyltransferase B [Prochlorococcus marinus str. MIT 9123]